MLGIVINYDQLDRLVINSPFLYTFIRPANSMCIFLKYVGTRRTKREEQQEKDASRTEKPKRGMLIASHQ